MEYRSYIDVDFHEVLALLKENLVYDTISDFLLREKLYEDPAWDPHTCFIATEKGKIQGILQGVLREIRSDKIGYIKLMAVDHSMRRRGIGTSLLHMWEKELLKCGATSLRAFDVPLNYFMPGLDPRYTPAVCFFEKSGFIKRGEAINMEVNLHHSDWQVSSQIKSLEEKGISVSRIKPDEFDDLMKLISLEWELWEYELRMAFNSDPSSVFVAREGGNIKAFAAYDGNNRGTGWFGPMGTHPDLRGKGVGSVLLCLCLEEMKMKGFAKSVIPWVEPVGFYSHYANAFISRVFWRYEKRL